MDLSKNVALETLICEGNKITSLDLSNNIVLRKLILGLNERFPGTGYPIDSLISLNITNCAELTHLNVRGCSLSSLDVSNNTALTTLNCADNQLTTLDLSNNIASEEIIIFSNESLHEVCVWTMPFPPESVLLEDDNCPNIFYTTECSGSTELSKYEDKKLSIYPNPTSDLITIETAYPDHYSIEITSLNGQQILIGEMEGTSHQIDLSTFQKGVYFIAIRSKDFVTTKKIIRLE